MNPTTEQISKDFHDRLTEFIASDITSWANEYTIQYYGDCIPYWYANSPKDNILLMAGSFENDICLIAGAARISRERQSPISVAVYGVCDVFRVDRIYRYVSQYPDAQIGLIWAKPKAYLAAMKWLKAKAHANGSSIGQLVEDCMKVQNGN